MRDAARLDTFYEQLKEIHKKNFPDWRFGQFMSNFCSWYGMDIFYLEEDRFLEKVAHFITANVIHTKYVSGSTKTPNSRGNT
jgi:hypothetical protein